MPQYFKLVLAFLLISFVFSSEAAEDNPAFIEVSAMKSNSNSFGRQISDNSYAIDSDKKLLISFSEQGYSAWSNIDAGKMNLIANEDIKAVVQEVSGGGHFYIKTVKLIGERVWVLGNLGFLVFNINESNEVTLVNSAKYDESIVGDSGSPLLSKLHFYDDNTMFYRSDRNKVHFIQLDPVSNTLDYLFEHDMGDVTFNIGLYDPVSKFIFEVKEDIEQVNVGGQNAYNSVIDIARWEIDLENQTLNKTTFSKLTFENQHINFGLPKGFDAQTNTFLFYNQTEYFVSIAENDTLQVKVNRPVIPVNQMSSFIEGNSFYGGFNGKLYKADIDWQRQAISYRFSGLTTATYTHPRGYVQVSMPIILSDEYIMLSEDGNYYMVSERDNYAQRYDFEPLPLAPVPRSIKTHVKNSIYDKDSDQLVVLGTDLSDNEQILYEYALNTGGELSFKNHFELPLLSYGELVEKSENTVFILIESNEDTSDYKKKYAVSYEISDSKAELKSQIEVPNGTFLNIRSLQNFMVDKNKMVIVQSVGRTDYPVITHCDFARSTCTNVALPENLSFVEGSSQITQFYPLEAVNQYLFVTRDDAKNELKLFIVEYEASNSNFKMIQALETEVLTYFNVNSFLAMKNGKEMFINGHLYTLNTESNQWQASEIVSSGINRHLLGNADETFFVDELSRTFAYSEKAKTFIETRQEENHSCNTKPLYVTKNDVVISLHSVSSLVCLTSSKFANPAPVLKIKDFDNSSLEILQDKELGIDFSEYVLNVDKATVSVGHSKLEWNSPFVTGVLNNEDMFYLPYDGTTSQDQRIAASRFNLEIQDSLEGRLHSLTVKPTNVNDAPELVEAVPNQTLTEGETYGGEMKEFVRDPDREQVKYSFSNLPSGMTGDENGYISGAPTKSGNYNVNVTATDSHNATLNFTFAITVSAKNSNNGTSGNANNSSSGGGSMNYMFIFILLLTTVYRGFARLKSRT